MKRLFISGIRIICVHVKEVDAIKMQDLKDGLKPFFIFVILFEVLYVIVAIILGFPMLIIADKIRMRKYYKNYKKRIKTNQGGKEQ